MSRILSLRWTIASAGTAAPLKPVLVCRRCDAPRAFESSGRFRLNANGKRLDAWLVYRCIACSASWNRPVFERRHRNTIGSAMLDALHANSPELAAAIAADRAGLSRWTARFEEAEDDAPSIRRTVLSDAAGSITALRITICAPGALAMRADRVLALGLGVSRTRISDIAGQGRITDGGAGAARLPRLLRDGAAVAVRLEGLPDAALLARQAAGLRPDGPLAD